jgi:hypothetical protein
VAGVLCGGFRVVLVCVVVLDTPISSAWGKERSGRTMIDGKGGVHKGLSFGAGQGQRGGVLEAIWICDSDFALHARRWALEGCGGIHILAHITDV